MNIFKLGIYCFFRGHCFVYGGRKKIRELTEEELKPQKAVGEDRYFSIVKENCFYCQIPKENRSDENVFRRLWYGWGEIVLIAIPQ